MRITIVLSKREVSVEVRDARSVPDMLKLCKSLGLVPLRWYVTTEKPAAGEWVDV